MDKLSSICHAFEQLALSEMRMSNFSVTMRRLTQNTLQVLFLIRGVFKSCDYSTLGITEGLGEQVFLNTWKEKSAFPELFIN